MPQKILAAAAFGVVTICLVSLLVLLGLFCIAYLFYFRFRVHSQGFIQLRYFSGPWVIRISVILFVIWWCVGEIIRLTFLRQKGNLFKDHDLQWQENICKGYIISNLGFAEPCLFLTLVFLLRAPLQRAESGILSRKWNGKTAGYIFMCCLPVFVLQLLVIVIGPGLPGHCRKERALHNLPKYFTRTFVRPQGDGPHVAYCTYPLLNTIILGAFAMVLTLYLFWLGSRILKLVINKGLQRRVYTLILSVACCLPLRVLLLGLSVFSEPAEYLFEALTFSAFLVLFFCAGICICMLVYWPVADSLSLRDYQDVEGRRRIVDDNSDSISLLANQNHPEVSSRISQGRNSDASTKQGSIFFRACEQGMSMSSGPFVELRLFSPSRDVTPPGSPPLAIWPMHAATTRTSPHHEP